MRERRLLRNPDPFDGTSGCAASAATVEEGTLGVDGGARVAVAQFIYPADAQASASVTIAASAAAACASVGGAAGRTPRRAAS